MDRQSRSNSRPSRRQFDSARFSGVGRAVAVILALGGFAFAAIWVMQSKIAPPKALCSILIDRTGSTQTQKTNALYRHLALETLYACESRGALTTISVAGDFPNFSPATFNFNYPKNAGFYTIKLRSEKQKARAKISEIMKLSNNSSTLGSDIVSAVQWASQTEASLASGLSHPKKYLVILSDGMQNSPGDTVQMLSSVTADPRLLEQTALSQAPNIELQGTYVSFYGVDSGHLLATSQTLPKWFEVEVQMFWSDLISARGGKLCNYKPSEVSRLLVAGC
jgi:hypothetical protein